MRGIAPLALLALLLFALPVGAQVKTDHLLGNYATTADDCAEGAMEFEIRRGIVEGPNVFCILGALKSTDIGTEAYEAKCTLAGEVKLGTLTFDLSKKPESIRITLHDSQDWITLYVCKADSE